MISFSISITKNKVREFTITKFYVAEIWSLFHGFGMAWKYGARKVMVESDNGPSSRYSNFFARIVEWIKKD